VVPLRCVGGRGKVIVEVEVQVFSQQGIRFVVIGSLWDGSYTCSPRSKSLSLNIE
jgi:hypothetical protein